MHVHDMKAAIIIGTLMITLLGSCQESQTNNTTAADSPPSLPISQKVVPANAYKEITWKQLTEVTFAEKYYEKEDAWMLFPTFGDSLKALEGQYIYISGHVIPLEPGRYVLSANSFSSCFFCGGAGPESVMELELIDTTKVYFTDEFRTFQGKFRLNDSNIDRMNYILGEAEPRE